MIIFRLLNTRILQVVPCDMVNNSAQKHTVDKQKNLRKCIRSLLSRYNFLLFWFSYVDVIQDMLRPWLYSCDFWVGGFLTRWYIAKTNTTCCRWLNTFSIRKTYTAMTKNWWRIEIWSSFSARVALLCFTVLKMPVQMAMQFTVSFPGKYWKTLNCWAFLFVILGLCWQLNSRHGPLPYHRYAYCCPLFHDL